ncbi:MAG: glycosyltransferase family 4 protein [Elusimicrobia bacterium]|nr:glycosyltransferase family 4 protein [Elusimicrobiota bacterium]
MSSVLSGLCRSLRSRSHQALIVSRPAPRAGTLGFSPGKGVVRIGSTGGLSRLVRHEAAGVVHLHFSGWPRPWLLGLEKALAPSGARLVVTFQDFDHPELPRGTAAQRAGLRRLLRRAHAVTAVSDFLRDRVEAGLPELRGNVRVVPNGVGLPAPQSGFRPPTRRPYILSVGRLAPYKGTDLLLMAYSQMKDPGADLVLCGAPFHGSHTAGLIAALRLGGRVHLTGLQPPARVAALLQGCLFYAAAPRAETFGMAVVEAMAAGKAVLAARVGAIPEHLRHGREGLLAAPKDVDGLRRGLERLSRDGALRRRLGAGARRAARRFSWDRVADQYLGVYREALGRAWKA